MHIQLVVGCFVVFLLPPAAITEEPKVSDLKPALVFTGTHSAIRHERFEVITNEPEWIALWKQHRGKGSDPPFTESRQELTPDFETHYVVCIFTGTDADLFVTTHSRSRIVLIRYSAHGHQTEGRPPEKSDREKAKEAAIADYCFVVLPRPMKSIIIEKDVQYQLGDPPIWKERKRFTVEKQKK